MRVESSQSHTAPAKPAAPAAPAPAADHPAPVPEEGLKLSAAARAAAPAGHDEDLMSYVAHKAHNPHGALHAVEAGEHAVHSGAKLLSRAAGRAAAQGTRAAAATAEAAHHGGHHGLIGKFETLIERGASAASRFFSRAIGAVPGGTRAANAVKDALRVPGRVLGPGVDKVLTGTRVGAAVRATGSGGRMVAQMGGRIPILGAVLGGVIGVVDVKSSLTIMQDPQASGKEKAIAGTQGLLSATSGALSVGALGVAGAAALGLTAPVSVPLLLTAAAVTGVGAFALSFFKKH